MDLSLREIFERARAAQEWIPPMEADLLYAAALRKAVELGVPLLPAKVMLREGGVLELVMQDTGPEPEEYRAPEAAPGDPRRLDTRALVYAAGAVGYELFTGLPPPRPPHGPGPELTGPLGDVVRVAMAQDRRERFSDLQQLFDAVSVIEPHRSPPEERGLLAALLARVKRWEERAQNAAAMAMLRHEYDTVEARLGLQEAITAKLSAQPPDTERLAVLESALKAVRAEGAMNVARLQQNVRELVEDKRRNEASEREREETREARMLLHPPRPPMLPILGAAVAAAIAASIATAVVLERMRGENAPAVIAKPIDEPAPAPAPAIAAPAVPANPIAATSAPAPTGAIPTPAPLAPAADAGPQMVGTPTNPAPTVAAPTNPAPAPNPVSAAASDAPAPKPVFPVPAVGAPPATGTSPASPLVAIAPAVPETPRKKARAMLEKGDTALERGRSDAATSAFKSALATDPTLAEAHRGLGMAYALQGNDAAAKKEYQLYLSAAPAALDAADIRAAINELNQRSKLGDAP